MDNVNLGMLIVVSIGVVWVIQLITWTVVVIRDPGFDYLRPDLDQASSTQPSVSAKKLQRVFSGSGH